MILILGANGQVGYEIRKLLKGKGIFLGRNECDLSQTDDLEKMFKNYKFSVLVNAAAYTQVDQAEVDRDLAYQINTVAPVELAKLCRQYKVKFVHFSTDYVFDGHSKKPYLETDLVSPVNFYGQTKAEGEQKILAENPQALIFRTSWVYSVHGKNFVKTMIQLGESRSELKVVADQFGSPTWANDLGRVALLGIEKDLKGLYHYSGEGECSWFDFTVEIKRLVGFKAQIIPIPSSEYPTKAARPNYSFLSKEKIRNDLNIHPPHWKDSLKLMIEDLGSEV